MTVKCQLCGCILDLTSKKKQTDCYVNKDGLTVCYWCWEHEKLDFEV